MNKDELIANVGKRVKVTFADGLTVVGHLVRGETQYNEGEVMLKPDPEYIPRLVKLGCDPDNLVYVTNESLGPSWVDPTIVIQGTYA